MPDLPKREPLYYLASPYEARDAAGNPNADEMQRRAIIAARAAGKMLERGLLVFCPVAHGQMIVECYTRAFGTPASWLRLDLRLLASCDEVAVLTLPGWRESSGVAAEIAEAVRLGKPVRYVGLDGEECDGK